jgi:integrase
VYNPNHGWRHTVKIALYKAKVDPKTRDMILGHGANVARKYEHGDVAMMAEAITNTMPNPLS